MPPEDKPQPNKAERKVLLSYLSGQAGGSANAALRGKLRYPQYGNLVDHDTLFNGSINEPAYSPARRWLVSPQIFIERVMDVFELNNLDTRRRNDMLARGFYGVTNPFVFTTESGVRDYDHRMLTGGHLLVMRGNAKWIADKQIFATQNHGKRKEEIIHRNPKDQWYPSGFAPESFKAMLDHSGQPTDEQLLAAIDKQFQLVLARTPSEAEQAKYLAFFRSMVEVGGNEAGLRQMLQAVLMEADFLYRVEFGGGETDEHGRKKLTPYEAAEAISYALGDRRPDAKLLAAAEEGRLNTKAEYRREVERLLADQEYYRGKVDGALLRIASPVETSHPKIVRFFREFFGYPAMFGLFKDPERALGKWVNPRRGVLGTSGRLIVEADKFVTRHVENDRDVFENLLTSDEYYVYDIDHRTEDQRRKTVEDWRTVWNELKDTNWRDEPRKIYEQHKDFFKAHQVNIRDNRRNKPEADLLRYMYYFEDHFPHGRTPFVIPPWAHGYRWYYSIMYGLPETPSRWHYDDVLRNSYLANKPDIEYWDYAIEQPFKIPHRKGILGHPAWLIAHSANFHTDPIRRGRWIQDKLLASRVPDVPITVDAKVPDHPEKTFRTRVQEVTSANECWRCHKHMNPLGLPFEMYDDFGRFRTKEELEHPDNIIQAGNGETTFNTYPTLPIDTSGSLTGTGDKSLDGEVKDALDLIDRLSQSDRVRQSIIRHAFRFYMGRNEMLSDSQTLIDADRAYVDSGGSFKAVIVSLLTSDSFMYRKEIEN